jgi:hypothetical protein
MLFSEIIGVYSDKSYAKFMYTLCVQNMIFFNVKAGGTVTGGEPCGEVSYNSPECPQSINMIKRLSRKMLSFPLPKGGDGRIDGTGSSGEGKMSPTTVTISMIITTSKKTGNPVILTVCAETPM